MSLPLSFPSLPEAPLVSVVMANYNYARFLPEALESAVGQTYRSLEVIVCDDGSTDHSCDIVAQYAQTCDFIHLIRQPNRGVAAALNAAFAHAKGDVICLLDADDVMARQKLAAVVQGFRTYPKAGMLMHAMQVVDAAGRRLYQMPGAAPDQGWIADAVRRRGGRWRNLPASALCFRRELAERLFPVPEAVFRREADGFLFTLAPLLAEVVYLPEALGSYRLHGGNLTGTTRLTVTTAQRHLDALERINGAVNERLRLLQPEAPPLDLRKHLNAREQRFTLLLFQEPMLVMLLPELLSLIKALKADDLYSRGRKLLGIAAYVSAMLVPVRWRVAWLSWMLGVQTIRRLLTASPSG